MSFLASLLKPSATVGPANDFWYQPVSTVAGASGIRVTPETAMRVTAVLACVRVIAESIATLPLMLYRKTGPDTRERATQHPLWDVLRNQPNEWQTSVEFIEMITGHAVLRGNGYAEIIPGRRGPVDQLIPLHPGRMQVEVLPDGRPRYKYTDEQGKTRTLLSSEVLHIRGLSSNGYTGLSPIDVAALAIGNALAMDVYNATVFQNSAVPRGVLRHPGQLGKEGRENLRLDWERIHAGAANAGRTAVLEEGMQYDMIGMTSEQAQFIEARQFNVTDIARIFRVPPHKIADLTKSAFSNIENQGQDFIQGTLLIWARKWEHAIRRDLIVAQNTYFAEFLFDGLLRGDIETRYKAYSVGRQWGWLSANDIRRAENMQPIDHGDRYLEPLNMRDASQPAVVVDDSTPPDDDNEGAEARIARGEQLALHTLDVMISDAADKIAGAELQALRQREDRAETDREQWNDWISSWYDDKHRVSVCRFLSPIFRSIAGPDGDADDEEYAGILAHEIVNTGRRTATRAKSVSALIESWELGERRAIVAQAIKSDIRHSGARVMALLGLPEEPVT